MDTPKHDPFDQWAENESSLGDVIATDDITFEVIPLNDSTRESLMDMIRAEAMRHPCRWCGQYFKDIPELKTTVWDGEMPMHKTCFEELKQLSRNERRKRGYRF